MVTKTFYEHVIKGLRLIYRFTPLPEATKLRWVDWLVRFPPFTSIVSTARRQMALEIIAAQLRQAPNHGATAEPDATPAPRDRFTRIRRVHAATRAVGYVAYAEEELPQQLPARIIAFYLPQFHPIPENDNAWGLGFTEWANVTRVLPQVEGQVQPRLPGELGFYDLRLPLIQERQVDLAKQYGLGGFCFHFYWFGGKRLLEAPLLQYLGNSKCDLPFSLCWANENWTRRWDGCDDDVVISQAHSEADDLAFITYVTKYFKDSRYTRVDGKPLLIVYRPDILPNAKKTAMRWRKYCRDTGIGEIHLASTTSFGQMDPRGIGFDAVVEFAPNNSNPRSLTGHVKKVDPEFHGNVYDWRSLVERSRRYSDVSYQLFRGVNPGWDNTPRKPQNGNVFLHASPRGYEEWLSNAIRDAVRRVPQAGDRLVFVNAWNEWAEGAYLEPDARMGYAYLAATRRALKRVAVEQNKSLADHRPAQRVCVVIHAFYPELLDEVFARLERWTASVRLVITTTPEREAAVRKRLEAWNMDAECRVFENHGRDILPFLQVANELADSGETLLVKLHTKRSPHRVDGDVWRQDLLDKLIMTENAQRIVDAFRSQSRLGMVGPEGHILPLTFYWGSNEAKVQYLCRIMGVREVDPAVGVFAAGSMFWARLDALRPLLDVCLDEAAFEEEHGQLDGTMAHAVERCLASVVPAAGYFMASTASLMMPATPLIDEYDFAESSRKRNGVPVVNR